MPVAAGTCTLGELIAARLSAAGARAAFGFPGGGGNLDLIEAVGEAGLRWVLAHTEGGAAFMACAAAELTGAPGVVVVGGGPGVTSVVNGVGHARLDRVPLVVISDRCTDEEARTTGHQVLDQRALLAPVVKHGATLEPGHAAAVVDHALATALAPPAGPVHLDLPRDLALAPVPDRAPERAPGAASARRSTEGDEADLAAALRRFRRPVILVGLEANPDPAPDALRAVAHRLGAAVLTTYKAKGAYPEDDERWAGVLTGGRLEAPVLAAADGMLAVGLDAVELLNRPWPYAAPVESLAASAAPDAYLRPRRRVVGGVGRLVRSLAERLRDHVPSGDWPASHVAARRDEALARLRLDADEPLPGWRVVEAVMAELPPRATIAVDAGAHMFPATSFARPSGPRRFLISNGLATMGFAVPSAVGAALARPDEVAVAFTGDGGMAYHASELETAARLGARVIVVVLNDASLSLIRIKQEARGYDRAPLDFERSRFDRLAEALGAAGTSVADAGQLRAAVRAALEEPRSTVIDVRTTGREYGRTLEVIRG